MALSIPLRMTAMARTVRSTVCGSCAFSGLERHSSMKNGKKKSANKHHPQPLPPSWGAPPTAADLYALIYIAYAVSAGGRLEMTFPWYLLWRPRREIYQWHLLRFTSPSRSTWLFLIPLTAILDGEKGWGPHVQEWLRRVFTDKYNWSWSWRYGPLSRSYENQCLCVH